MNITAFDCQNKAGNESKTRNGVTMKTYKEQYGKRVRFIIAQLAGLFLLPLVAVAAAPTLTDYYWATNSAGESVSASFGDVANWWSDVNGTPAAGLPDACSCACFWFVGPSVADGGYTVTLPTMQTKATLSIHARDDIPITFDGSGNVFQALSTDTDNYGEHFISIYGGQNSPDAGFEQAYFENASFEKLRMLRVTLRNGDANLDGRITAADAAMILRTIVKLSYMNAPMRAAADCNGDGEGTAADAAKILRIVVQLESEEDLH